MNANDASLAGAADEANASEPTSSVWTIFITFLRLGCTSFGGPIAHLGYFHDEFVTRRKWLNEHAYADLVALCQFLPGPASSQVGIAIGMSRRGFAGAIAAWLGFTAPSAVILIAFGIGLAQYGGDLSAGWLHGLKVVAVAVVAQALWGMGKNLCPDRVRASFAAAAAVVATLLPTAVGQIGVIAAGGVFGCLLLHKLPKLPHAPLTVTVHRGASVAALAIFFLGLLLLPLAATAPTDPLYVFNGFYRAGALVFGGGHVVLPLLQSVVVPPELVSNDLFLAGYGAAQAVPGPLFTLAAFLGSVMRADVTGWAGGILCLVAIFLPAFLLVVGVLPFWERLRRYHAMQSAMQGINAAVVGVLLAAFHDPVWTSAILRPADFALAVVGFLLLAFWKLPPWLVVALSAAGGVVIA